MSTKQCYDVRIQKSSGRAFNTIAKLKTSLIKEYGVSQTALSNRMKPYSTLETDEGTVLTVKHMA